MQEAGFGVLGITSIYGVRDHEDQALLFLSEEWIDALDHSLHEGKRCWTNLPKFRAVGPSRTTRSSATKGMVHLLSQKLAEREKEEAEAVIFNTNHMEKK